MPSIVIPDSRAGYMELVDYVITAGRAVSPRGLPTREVQGLTIKLTDPRQCLVTGVNRKANPAIAAAEALQLVAGVSVPDLMVKIAPNFAKFLDGGAFYGAYGPRLRSQLPQICKILRNDPSSRRAIAQIWRSDDLFVEGSNDYPCTMGFTFHIRDNELDMHTHMRSNDVWWGYTYDVTQFCFLQMTMAKMLGVGIGVYYHHADSFHIYERDIDAARELQLGSMGDYLLDGAKSPSWEALRRLCIAGLNGDRENIPAPNGTVRTFCDWIQDRLERNTNV